MRFFRNPQDLSEWVKELGSKKAAALLVNLTKVGKTNLADIVETSKRIVEANDGNAAEVLFDILKKAGITEDDLHKTEDGIEQVRAANELLSTKVIAQDEHATMVKQAQIMRQPGQYDMPLRICPKLPWSVGKKLISTYNCRHYCLDGIVLDDDPMRVYCGELLWRRHVADKFSHDYQDRKTGELVGGYINERFYKFPDAGTPDNPDVPRDGGNPMRLKPGERTRIPRPHQWSVERRMQEARKKGSTKDITLGKKASAGQGGWLDAMVAGETGLSKSAQQVGAQSGGYIDFSIDAAGDLVMTPTSEGIEEAKARIEGGDTSDDAFLSMIEDHLANGWRIVPPEEVGALTSALIITNDQNPDDLWSNIAFYQVRSELQDFADGKPITWEKAPVEKSASADGRLVEAKKKGKAVNPWAVCHTTVDKDENPEKYERCVLDVKKDHPVKAEAEVARKVIMAAGRQNFVRISSKVVDATSGDDDILKAFSMSIDLKNEGLSAEDAVIRIAEETGMTIARAAGIQSLALKKLAANGSNVYVMDPDGKKGRPMSKSDDEVQADATEIGLLDEQE